MVDFGQLRVVLGLESAQFKAGLADAKNSLVGWRDETNKSGGDMLKWGAAIAITAAPLIALGYELVSLTNQAAQFGKAIKDNSRDLGLSTEQYQKWTHAAIAAGSSAEEITGSIRMMSIRLKDAVDPASDVSRYLKAMGVSALDTGGQLRPMNDVLMEILPALNALPEGMERNQASMVLFGRSFSNIADLTSLSREELQKLMEQAPVFSDDKIQKMDDMAVEMALLNEQIQIMSVDLGEDLIPLAQDMIGVFQELGPVIKGVADTLHGAATGTTMMVQGLQLLYTQWQYGMDSPQMKKLQADVQAYAQGESDERNGISNKPIKSLTDDAMMAQIWRERLSRATQKTEKETGVLTSDEIRDKKLELRELTNITIPDLTKKLKDARLTGLKTDIEDASIALEKATNKANDLVKAVGGASAATGLTYNEQFKSSLEDGGVGPDMAGYSDLANMSIEELQAIVSKGKLGGSVGQAEKAQQYIDRMGSKGGATPAAGAKKKSADPVRIDKETAKSADTLTTTLTSAYTTRLDAFTKYGDDMLDLYLVQESQDLTHWTAQTEMMRISLQNMGDSWREYVDFAAKFPTIHNIGIVIWEKNKPDWTPESNPIFMQTARRASLASQELSFASADFSSVKGSQKKDDTKSAPTVLTVVVPQETPAGTHATTQANSRGLAKTVI